MRRKRKMPKRPTKAKRQLVEKLTGAMMLAGWQVQLLRSVLDDLEGERTSPRRPRRRRPKAARPDRSPPNSPATDPGD